MNFGIFDFRRVRQALTILFLAGALLTMFPPQHATLQWWADQAFLVALGYLFLGLFFLIINRSRLMFVCIGCSAAICFFKVEMSKTSDDVPLGQTPVCKPCRDASESSPLIHLTK